MNLWIRSQDKKCLTMVNHLYIDNNHHIRQQDDLILGTYETKRALEILDEIENILQPNLIWKEPKTDIKYDENFIETLANNICIQTTQQVEYDLKQAGQIVYKMP